MDKIAHIRDLFTETLPLFNALGDPVRQQLLLAMISHEQQTVGELTAGTNLSRPTVSFHLKVLREAGIITSRKEGRNVYYYPRTGDYFQAIRDLVHEVDKITNEEGKQ